MTGVLLMPSTCPAWLDFFFSEIMLYGRYRYSHLLGCNSLSHLSFPLYSVIFIVHLSVAWNTLCKDYRQNTFRSKHSPVLKDLAVYPQEDKKTIFTITTFGCAVQHEEILVPQTEIKPVPLHG